MAAVSFYCALGDCIKNGNAAVKTHYCTGLLARGSVLFLASFSSGVRPLITLVIRFDTSESAVGKKARELRSNCGVFTMYALGGSEM